MNPFFVGVSVVAVSLLACLVYGANRWQRTGVKIVTLTAGVLLVSLAAWVVFVLFLAESARRGAPM
jgi:hypothetical protein